MARDIASMRATAREQLRNRAQESYSRKDSFGTQGGYFKEGLSGVNFWWPSEGRHIIDIIPFIAGKNMPTRNGFVKEGEWAIYVDLLVHNNVGPNQDPFICLKQNYGKRCPICEERDRLRLNESPSDELKKKIQALNVSRRCVYNIIVHDTEKDYARGVQVWDSSHYNFQRHIEVLAEGRDGNIRVFYADPDEGKSIQFTREGRGQQTTKYLGHQFLDRDYVISDDQLNAARSLDDILKVCTYEEIQEAFLGGIQPVQESNDDEVPFTPKQVAVSSPRLSTTETPSSAPAKHATPSVEKAEDKVASSEQDEQPKREEAASPPPRRRVSVVESASPPPPAALVPPRRTPVAASETQQSEPIRPTESSGVCPAGGKFGEVDSLKDGSCTNCDVWEDCAGEAERIRKAEQPSRRRR